MRVAGSGAEPPAAPKGARPCRARRSGESRGTERDRRPLSECRRRDGPPIEAGRSRVKPSLCYFRRPDQRDEGGLSRSSISIESYEGPPAFRRIEDRS
jgi:hypothetical protein